MQNPGIKRPSLRRRRAETSFRSRASPVSKIATCIIIIDDITKPAISCIFMLLSEPCSVSCRTSGGRTVQKDKYSPIDRCAEQVHIHVGLDKLPSLGNDDSSTRHYGVLSRDAHDMEEEKHQFVMHDQACICCANDVPMAMCATRVAQF